jgi:hypothetical protein
MLGTNFGAMSGDRPNFLNDPATAAKLPEPPGTEFPSPERPPRAEFLEADPRVNRTLVRREQRSTGFGQDEPTGASERLSSGPKLARRAFSGTTRRSFCAGYAKLMKGLQNLYSAVRIRSAPPRDLIWLHNAAGPFNESERGRGLLPNL